MLAESLALSSPEGQVVGGTQDTEVSLRKSYEQFLARERDRMDLQAVDIAEQVAFLLTGEFQEFTRPDLDDGH